MSQAQLVDIHNYVTIVLVNLTIASLGGKARSLDQVVLLFCCEKLQGDQDESIQIVLYASTFALVRHCKVQMTSCAKDLFTLKTKDMDVS